MTQTTPAPTPAKPRYVAAEMKSLGLLLWATGCVRLYKDGDGFGTLFRAWHPVTWLVALLVLVPCALMGERLAEVVPIRLSKFWQRNRQQLQWVQPWTRLDQLKRFDHSKAVREALSTF